MNAGTVALLFDVVRRLEKNIVARECPAIVAIAGDRKLVLSDYDYLRDSATAMAFESRAAGKAREIGATRWVLAVPQVWIFEPPTAISVRAVSNHPLREGEQEAITWMSFDGEDGVDYGRVAYARRPNGEPVFEEPEIFEVGIRPRETMPGFALLQEFLGETRH
ncbi:hypothetical protein [Planotetraspora kaengkrachanensis]|uniref:Uncharacterized protein n=1 Tax=Planotetraspora kaengkrachanensis TaxID=575193 RepID=A0A8J3PSX5_9ACTN|nr:hypothetical protein [Planotetraspora kaengkrachanensis]GIG79969.1 hypothetical protein Pka01_30960 [Planotetraspora kaengkrachanensis]